MVDLSLMPGLLSNDSSICFGKKKGEENNLLFYCQTLHVDVWRHPPWSQKECRTLSVVSKQFRSLSSPRLVPSPSALRPLLLGGRVNVSGSLEPHARLRILAFFCRICQHSQPSSCSAAYIVWAEPAQTLLKPRECFRFRVIERVQHINMLGQCYQPVSLLGVIDDGPSTLGQQTS